MTLLENFMMFFLNDSNALEPNGENSALNWMTSVYWPVVQTFFENILQYLLVWLYHRVFNGLSACTFVKTSVNHNNQRHCAMLTIRRSFHHFTLISCHLHHGNLICIWPYWWANAENVYAIRYAVPFGMKRDKKEVVNEIDSHKKRFKARGKRRASETERKGGTRKEN